MVTQFRRDMESQLDKFKTELRKTDRKVDRLSEDMQKLQQTVLQAIREVSGQLERSAESDRAQAELDRLNATREKRFGGRQRVRRLAHALVGDPLQTHLGHSTIETLAMQIKAADPVIEAPDFWLSSVTVALVADLDGDTERSNKAFSISTAEDRPKIELFIGLLAAHQERDSEAARFIDHYLETVDPKALNLEFPHVLNTLAEGELGDRARSYAAESLRRHRARLDEPALGQQLPGAGHGHRHHRHPGGLGEPERALVELADLAGPGALREDHHRVPGTQQRHGVADEIGIAAATVMPPHRKGTDE